MTQDKASEGAGPGAHRSGRSPTHDALGGASTRGPANDDREDRAPASGEGEGGSPREDGQGGDPIDALSSETISTDGIPDVEKQPEPDQAAQLEEKLLRALAESENLRRRSAREVEEARRFAVSGFARDLLDVADNLGRALGAAPADQRAANPALDTLAVGVEMTHKSLLSVFEKHKIKQVEPKRGDRFDAKLHQAMFEVPTDELPPGAIAEVMTPGYVIAERLLRPAMVGVAKAVPKGEPGQNVDQNV